MKKIIANFKMNQTQSETKRYLMSFASRFKQNDKVEVTLCLPFTNLAIADLLLQNTQIKLGAQNISEFDSGSYTGEVSGSMLKEAGVEMVIIGHSERRQKFKESNKLINRKIKAALKNGLGVILCVGESLAEKNTLKTLESLRFQIEEALKGLYENELEKIIIAYEPIWAIGTGKNATAREVEYAVKVIRKVIEDDFSAKAGKDINIIYGGSLNVRNISTIMRVKGIDGALVGGASLDENVFLNMIGLI